MLNSVRKLAFWIVDFLSGSKVRKAYMDIARVYTSDSDSIETKEYMQDKLNILIGVATKNTEYYAKYADKNDIKDFPIINKKLLKEFQGSFLSKEYEENELFTMSTSGSTGTPFTSYQNVEKKRRVNAEAIFFNGIAGYGVGEKLVHLRSLNIKSKKSKLHQFLQNEKLIDVQKLDNQSIEKLITDIINNTKLGKGTLLSYASTYDALANYIRSCGSDISIKNIKGIISTSEILNDETRNIIMKAFNSKCYSRYANMENGMLGQDSPSHPNVFIINEANYFIEVLKLDRDEQADDGELGRIVVTDLYNFAMPMLRYDTGDVGEFTTITINGTKKRAIKNFGGRQIDMIYDAKGEFVSPHKISVSFWGIKELNEFQFIQVAKQEYHILVNLNGKFVSKESLNATLQDILGSEAKLKFIEVDNIPTLKSGKRKYIMNTMI